MDDLDIETKVIESVAPTPPPKSGPTVHVERKHWIDYVQTGLTLATLICTVYALNQVNESLTVVRDQIGVSLTQKDLQLYQFELESQKMFDERILKRHALWPYFAGTKPVNLVALDQAPFVVSEERKLQVEAVAAMRSVLAWNQYALYRACFQPQDYPPQSVFRGVQADFLTYPLLRSVFVHDRGDEQGVTLALTLNKVSDRELLPNHLVPYTLGHHFGKVKKDLQDMAQMNGVPPMMGSPLIRGMGIGVRRPVHNNSLRDPPNNVKRRIEWRKVTSPSPD